MSILPSIIKYFPSILSVDQTISIVLYGLPLATQLSLLHQVIKVGSYTMKQGIEIIGSIKRNIIETNSPQTLTYISLQEDKEEDCLVVDHY
jgi:hypothetical protein